MSSRTVTNRLDHQVWAIGPRAARALIPSSTGRGRDGGGYQLLTDGLPGQLEYLPQVVRGQLREPALAIADYEIGQGLLLLDHLVDLLFQGPGADELAYLHVPGLANAERPIGGLVLHGGVPPSVQVDHVAGRGQVEPGAAGLQ